MNIDILQKTSAGTTLIPIMSQLFDERTIYFSGEIDEENSVELIKGILELNRKDSEKPIKLLITSGGGSVQHGLACYDAIVTSPAPVWTYCLSSAYSMAAILFMSGKRRFILPNSKIMLHQPLIGQNNGGNTESIKSLSDSLRQTQNQLVDIICKHTGMSRKKVNKDIGYDHYYTSKDAIEGNLADEIVGINHIIQEGKND